MRRNNKFKKEPDKNQKKITQFFIRNPGSSSSTPQSQQQTQPVSSASSTPTISGFICNRRPPQRPRWVDDGDYSEVEVLRPPTPPPKVVVDLTVSGDERSDVEEETQKIKKEEAQASTSIAPTQVSSSPSYSPLESPQDQGDNSNGAPSSGGDDILSQVDIDEIVRLSQSSQEEGAPSPHGSEYSSSGDEVMSQIDVDEIVRSSQSSLNSTADSDDRQSPSLLCSTPNKENHEFPPPSQHPSQPTFKSPPPKISPKSQLTKYSPKRHFRAKRTSEEAALDDSSTDLPSRSNSQSPSKRRLNFGGNSQPPPQGTGGQARYFLRNFLSILTEVITDTFHSHLLHPEDHRLVQDFVTLSLDAQHLFVRLFQRKWTWRPTSKLNNKNKELPPDLTQAINELLNVNFLEQISPENCGSLEEVLEIFDLTKISSLAKKMKLNPQKKTKEVFKSALLNIRKSQKTLTGATGSEGILKHALTELGPCFRVTASCKLAFSRLFLLHAPPQYWEVENDQASNQLLIVLLSQMGQMEYPNYKIQKMTRVYPKREELIRFHEAFTLHSNLVAHSEVKDWQNVVELAKEAKTGLEVILEDADVQKHDLGLPQFLKIYTAGSVLAHSLWMGVEGYQKEKRWREANEMIRFLLGQQTYLRNYRGRWWERLVINLETHLKRGKEEIKEVLEEGLRDDWLKENHRLTLSQRWEKVRMTLEKKKGKKKKVAPKKKPKPKKKAKGGRRGKQQYVDESSEEEEEEILEEVEETQVVTVEEEEEMEVNLLVLKNVVPTRTITGEKLDQGPGAMGKSVFISAGGNRLGSVEQFVIDYYQEEHGYSWGLHGEGSTVVTMYGLLFWDIIFSSDIPDAFHHKYQPFPLDLHFEEFFERRKEEIETKLELITSVLSMDEVVAIVEEVWRDQQKKLSIVNWAMFEEGVERLTSLMRAMGRKMIGVLCRRLASNYRHYCSGFPDLVVWREEDGDGGDEEAKVLFVEVKGPGDHLSEKQQLWLDFLVGNGIPAEVCHVKAVSNKRIRLNK